MIKGDKTYLTELDQANAETIRGWLNDPEVYKSLMVGHTPISEEDERRYYERHTNTGDERDFEIHVAEDGRYIGNIGIKGIHLVHRRVEMGVAIRMAVLDALSRGLPAEGRNAP